MSAKAIVIICAQALFANAVISQCFRPGGEYAWGLVTPFASSCGYEIGNGYALGGGLSLGFTGGIEAVPTSGGSFPIQSASSIAPNGISLTSENAYEGCLNVIGELPFLSTVVLEELLPTAGAGAVHHSCGNGYTAITSEIGNSADVVGFGSAGIGPGVVGYGSTLDYSGIAGLNCGHASGGRCGCGLY